MPMTAPVHPHSKNPGYAYAVLVLSNTYNIIQKTAVTIAWPNAFLIVSNLVICIAPYYGKHHC